jgi:hypothetical protein
MRIDCTLNFNSKSDHEPLEPTRPIQKSVVVSDCYNLHITCSLLTIISIRISVSNQDRYWRALKHSCWISSSTDLDQQGIQEKIVQIKNRMADIDTFNLLHNGFPNLCIIHGWLFICSSVNQRSAKPMQEPKVYQWRTKFSRRSY